MSLNEITQLSSNKELSETGGAHNQKGVNFQRTWSIIRMFELESEDKDFLLLFETFQDIAELDSETDPKHIHIYQVKKKENENWKWKDLTNLYELNAKKSKTQLLTDFKKSPLGKLYSCIASFKILQSTGHFVSNIGCSLPLESGGSYASAMPSNLSVLESNHKQKLSEAIASNSNFNTPPPALDRIFIKKIALHPDALDVTLIGAAHQFLKDRSPQHANQAQSLIQALQTKIAPLCAKTDACSTFKELVKERGYSRNEFRKALAALEEIPDVMSITSDILSSWTQRTEIGEIERIRTKVEIGKIFQLRLAGKLSNDNMCTLLYEIENWLKLNQEMIQKDILTALLTTRNTLISHFPNFRNEQFNALFLVKVAELCVAPI